MRQAGRYLPEYRKVRDEAGSFLNLCFDARTSAEVTLQPLGRFDLDAAIIFSDILIVPHAMGLGLKFVEGEGPVLETVRSSSDLKRLHAKPDAGILGSIAKSLVLTKPQLPPHVALIGFSGAPWTVSTYMVEGGTSNRSLALDAARNREPWFLDLISRLTDVTVAYLVQQADAGADALQIFDSWAGGLEGGMLDDYCIEPIARIIKGVRAHHASIPIIVFARGAGARHADVLARTGAAAIGVEQDVDLAALLAGLPVPTAVQGNLDPMALLGSEAELDAAVHRVLAGVPKERHIFNLGHGVPQATQPEMVRAAIDAVRRHDGG